MEEGINKGLARGAKKGDCPITALSSYICVYNNCLNVITVGAVFRVTAIIRVAAVFGALKIIFSDLYFFLHDNLQVDIEQKKKFFWEALFFIFKPHAFQVGF
jgi:hypothetical protein